jgi:hypothetical protein
MSRRYKGAIISATPPTTTGGESGTAPGEWTLQQQMQAQGGSVWPSQPPPPYIEDVFSTWLYDGTGSAQSIVNGINESGKGALTWIKGRNLSWNHTLYDTVNGVSIGPLNTADTGAPNPANNQRITAFNSNGFTLGTNGNVNGSGYTYASWTFRKQPKFFDVVTWSGNGASNRQISHSLGSVPGCIIIKKTNGATEWVISHRSLATSAYLKFTSAAVAGPDTNIIAGAATSTYFLVGNDDYVNASGGTYVAYVFANDAGGFGLTETDNVISCGSYTGNASSDGPVVTLGYEPQFLMIKRVTTAGSDWIMVDNMRGMPVSGSDAYLSPTVATAETTSTLVAPNATGFQIKIAGSNINATSNDYIYIAIRRGPMKVPTDATKVFDPVAYTGTGTNDRIITSSITPDTVIPAQRNDTASKYWYDRLRGNGTYLITTGTNAEGTDGAVYGPQFNKVQTGYQQGTSDSGFLNSSTIPTTYINYLLKRAPSFFDEVCWTGAGGGGTLNHNLTVVPELIIWKARSYAGASWYVYSNLLTNPLKSYVILNASGAQSTAGTDVWTTPTTTQFGYTSYNDYGAGVTYVAYLFATCAGVSKVGSYTGTGATQTIDCGFTGGARWVMIKRTNSTGDWYVWDTARGMVSGTDPSLLLNSTAAEVNANSVYTATTGFQIVSTAAGINASGSTYIFLAIA